MSDAAKIRALNDAARRTLIGCRVMLTSGVQALGRLPEVLAAVRSFDGIRKSRRFVGLRQFISGSGVRFKAMRGRLGLN